MRRVYVPGVAAVMAALSTVAHAHHSQAMFDMSRVVTLEGVVTRFEWANPHVYIFLEQTTADGQGVEWKIEAVGPGPLRRLGWSRDTLAEGDRIEIAGNPDRDEGTRLVNLLSLRKGADVLFDSQGLVGVLATAGDAPTVGTASLDGTWATLLAMEVIVPLGIAPKDAIALTSAGTAALDRYEERTMSPALECIPQPAPFLMYVPDLKRITTTDAAITITGEYDAAQRTVHLDVANHDGVTPSLQGHSIGRWDGATLVIDTAAFADHRIGNAFGVPSGAQKRLIERLTRNQDGLSLTYQFELSDPEFLAAPVTGAVRWVYRPNSQFEPEECNRENARRFAQ
jgi:hypothetical protein